MENKYKIIDFDIKFQKDIESGRYKVITENGKPVSILKWDMKGSYPILGCTMVDVSNYEGDETWEEERPIAYTHEGHPLGYIPSDKTKLCIVTDEFETEEERIKREIIHYLEITNNQMTVKQYWDWKNRWLPWLEKQSKSDEH